MDRYEDENTDSSKQTRINKNQELYTDVYLNNAYVDINDIKEFTEEIENDKQDDIKINKEVITPYFYEEKNYDINDLINEAIKNRVDDNLKRNFIEENDLNSIIESINEENREKEKDDTLLSDLMPDHDTTIMAPLEEPILDTSLIDTSIIHKDDMSQDMVKDLEVTKEDFEEEMDESFKNETKTNKKVIFIIIGILLLLVIIVGLLIWKKIIHF